MSIHVLLLYLALYAGQGTGHDKASAGIQNILRLSACELHV